MTAEPLPWERHREVVPIGDGRRVLHVSTRFLRGGAERNIAHFIEWERAAGFDVELAVGPDSLVSDEGAGIRVHRLTHLTRNVNPVRDALGLIELRRLISRGRYDIVHTHLSKAGILGRVAAKGVASRTVHTVHMASFGAGYGRIGSLVFRLAEQRSAALSHALAFVGNDLLDLYAGHGIGRPEQRLVVHSPINLERLLGTRAWTDDERQRARLHLGVDRDAPLIASVGALEPRKRHAMLIEELATTLKATGATLAIAGEGPERRPLERRAQALGVRSQVQLVGHLDDVAELLAASDVLVHASSAEGVPQVVIQALAAAVPVVATDVTGLRETVDAPIAIASASGLGLGEQVRGQLANPLPPLEPQAFEPWSCPAVDDRIALLHEILVGSQNA